MNWEGGRASLEVLPLGVECWLTCENADYHMLMNVFHKCCDYLGT